MARPTTRQGSRKVQFSKKVPADLREKARGKRLPLRVGNEVRTVKVGEKVSVSTRTADPIEGNRRHADLTQQVEAFFESLRQAPKPLSIKQQFAFAGAMRAFVIEMFDEDPLRADEWRSMRPVALRLLNEDLVDQRPFKVGEKVTWETVEGSKAVIDYFKPTINHVAVRSGIWPAEDDFELLTPKMIAAMDEAAEISMRKAEGDYSPDAGASRYPELLQVKEQVREPEERLSITDLFDSWSEMHIGAGKAEGTIADYAGKIASLKDFLCHDDAQRVIVNDVWRWANHLSEAKKLSARTINGKYVAAVGAVFEAARRSGKLDANPAKGVRLTPPRPRKVRNKGYSTDEAVRILKAALAAPSTLSARWSPWNKSAIRWGPWICAHTGCRITEAMQLRKEDLLLEEGVLCLRITPEGGSVKSGHFRLVPVHQQLLDLGLEEFFKRSAEGALFFEPQQTDAEAHKAAQNAGDKIRDWIKCDPSLKVPHVQPNHAWRHRFKSEAIDVGMDDRLSKALMGHADTNVSSSYGRNSMKALQRAIGLMRRYETGL
ncbi:tyrosine-type recombinase/integrase [Thalassorhabdomicrobium marinisediminis]|uniref:tyrosine-type recombinase/integrase n=1 Tax=Thalassorhabdomicrobium marinisediminis TaxID=2170577 RepID=UPI002493B65F|nr:tyrosine-type recombinase/integrase [Thalassorhabdomicrobium marinisediminis]